MTLSNNLKKICLSLGNNNNPAYAVMAIATVKGICRPMFTMMDKTEKPETKKYTALREGLTEAIAIPAYWGCANLAGKMAKLIKDNKAQGVAKKNLLFIGVCTAALIVIPAACSIAIKPFMALIKKNQTKSEPKNEVEPKFDTGAVGQMKISEDKTKTPISIINNVTKPTLASFTTLAKVQPSMKVGNV